MTSMHTEDLALFALPPMNTAEINKTWVEYRPTCNTQGEFSAVEFHIPGNSLQYIDLANTELHTELAITKENGDPLNTDPPNYEESGLPIDMIHHTMWSNVIVEFNQTTVSFSNTNYMYKAAIETILGYNHDAKVNQLSVIGFTGDEGDFEATHPTNPLPGRDASALNGGLFRRSPWFRGNKTVQFAGPILADICNQNRLILNGVDINIKLYPTKDSFHLMTFPNALNCKLVIKDIHLDVCKVDVSPSVMLAQNSLLKKNVTAKYPYQRTEVKTFHIPARQSAFTCENVYQGAVPSKMIIGLVDQEAYHGDFARNPLKFGHYNLASAGFYVDGIPTPKRPINLDIDNNKYLDGLLSLYRVSDKLWDNTDLGITRQSYKDGLTLIGFDVDPTSSSDFRYIGVTKIGHTRLELKFHREITRPLVCVVYATFPGVIEINEARVVEPMPIHDLFNKENGISNITGSD